LTFPPLEGLSLAHLQEGGKSMANALTIGGAAKTSGVAAKTIRYYEEIGVLPTPRRTASGYRLYDQPGVERLRFIRRARALGLPLQQLKTLTTTLNGEPRAGFRPQLLALVREQLAAVRERVIELELHRQQLEEIVHRIETSAPRRHAGGCRCLETKTPHTHRQRSGESEATP
jgi:MerR family transcriptional regulator, copper efflux regulator